MRELKQDWKDVFLAFRIARDPRKVLLGAAGGILSVVYVYVLAWFFHNLIGAISSVGSHDIRARALKVFNKPLVVYESIRDLCNIHHLHSRAWIFIAFMALGLLIIWSFFGGAISRIAAVELAKDERIEMREARKFACHKFWAYLWAPIVPAIGALIFGLFILLGGLLGGLIGLIPAGVGEFFTGIFFGMLFPLALLLGFLIALILIGGLAGGGLMMPAISAEGTDAFDSISRAYSYVYSRPWRFLWYSLVALGYGLLCVAFIYCFTWLTVESTMAAGKIGLKAINGGSKYMDIRAFYGTWGFRHHQGLAWGTHMGALLVGVWAHLFWSLFLGFVVSMVITGNTIIYFLMRKAVDGTEMTEVFTEEQEEAEGAEGTTEEKPAGETAAEEKKQAEAAEGEEAAKKRAPRKKKEETKEEGKEEGKEQGGESKE